MFYHFVRVTAEIGEPALPMGAIVEVDSHDMAYVPGFGLEQQVVGVFIALPDGRRAHLRRGQYAESSPEEAKRWRADQKRLRARTRRGLPV